MITVALLLLNLQRILMFWPNLKGLRRRCVTLTITLIMANVTDVRVAIAVHRRADMEADDTVVESVTDALEASHRLSLVHARAHGAREALGDHQAHVRDIDVADVVSLHTKHICKGSTALIPNISIGRISGAETVVLYDATAVGRKVISLPTAQRKVAIIILLSERHNSM